MHFDNERVFFLIDIITIANEKYIVKKVYL